jgi:hypothetical protein
MVQILKEKDIVNLDWEHLIEEIEAFEGYNYIRSQI